MSPDYDERFDNLDSKVRLNNVLGAGNLLLNLQQSYNVTQARQQLDRIEQGLMQESMRKELLETIREFVFSSGKQIQNLASQVSERPLQIYIQARVTESEFTSNHISPATFPEFQDKEYTQKVLESLTDLLRASKSSLDAGQVERAEEAVKYIMEMPALHRSLFGQVAKESLDASEEEWKTLAGSRSRKTLLGSLLTGGSVIVCPLIFMCSLSGLPLALNSQSSGGGLSGLGSLLTMGVMIVLPLIALVIGIFLLLTRTPTGYKALKSSRDISKKIMMSAEERKRSVELFGDLSAESLKEMRDNRQAYIDQVMA